jgi:hypothetical protein
MDTLLVPALPSALNSLLKTLYPDETLARRALLAPWPWTGFSSAWDERTLWLDIAANSPDAEGRRLYFEGILDPKKNPSGPGPRIERLDQPFFPAPNTGGTLRSPYTELSDSDYWCFVGLWESEKRAREVLESEQFPELGFRSSLKFLEWIRHRGWLARTLQKLRGIPDKDPRLTVWSAHDACWVQQTYPNYL